MKKKILVGILVALMLAIMPIVPALAASSDDVDVTVTPAVLSITVAPTTWAPNDIVGDGITPKGSVAPDTIYYANPNGDNITPSDPVVDGECRFTITNGSSVNSTITINFPDMSSGDASTNSNTGTNGTTTFGAYSYFSGDDYSTDKVIAKSTGSDAAYTNLGSSTNIKFGLTYETQTNAWSSSTPMTSTVNVALTYYMP